MEDLGFTGSNIIGGTPVTEGRYGFQTGIIRSVDELLCGGSLIAPNVVLTSHACLQNAERVFLGCTNFRAQIACQQIEVVQKKFFTHLDVPNNFLSLISGSVGDFDKEFPSKAELQNDVDLGILILEHNSSQQPVSLPAPRFFLNNRTLTELKVLGWGSTNALNPFYDDISVQLQEATVQAVDSAVCNAQIFEVGETMQNFPPSNIINEFKICAAGDKKDACGADRGGPLLLSCPSEGKDLLVGVASIGFRCALNGIPRIYSALNVKEVFDFIQDIVEEQGHQLRVDFNATSSDRFCNRNSSPTANESPTPFPTFKAELWTCDPESFGNFESCDCECGLPDPDCDFSESRFICRNFGDCIEGVCEPGIGTYIVGGVGASILLIIIIFVTKKVKKVASPPSKNDTAGRQASGSLAVATEVPIPVADTIDQSDLVGSNDYFDDEIPVAMVDKNIKYDEST